MRHIIIVTLCVVLAGCTGALQKRINSLQQEVNRLKTLAKEANKETRDEQKETERELDTLQKNQRASLQHIVRNRKKLAWLWKLANTPGTRLDSMQFRKQLLEVVKKIKVGNYVIGKSIYGPAYELVLAENLFLKWQDLTRAMKFYNIGINNLSAAIKKHTIFSIICGPTFDPRLCEKLLRNAHYNRACIHALMNNKAKAMKDILWLFNNNHLYKFSFDADTRLKNLHSHPKFKMLVKARVYKP